MADENTVKLGAEVETADAVRSFAELRETAVKELRAISDSDPDARRIVFDFDEAEAALDRVQREFQETGKVSEESLSRAEAAVRKVGGAFGFEEEKLRLISPEFEKVSKASRTAEEAVSRFGKAAETGSRGAERAATQAAIAVDRLEQEIRQIRAGGGIVPPEYEKRLLSLRGEIDRGTVTLGRFRATADNVGDSVRKATRDAGEFEGQLHGLEDILGAIDPRLGAAAVKFGAIFGGVAAGGLVLEQGIQGVRTLTKALGATEETAGKVELVLRAAFDPSPINRIAKAAELFAKVSRVPLDLIAEAANNARGELDKFTAAQLRSADSAATQREQDTKLREQLGLLPEELEKSTVQFARVAEASLKFGSVGSGAAQNLLGNVRDLIKGWEDLGLAVPASLRRLEGELVERLDKVGLALKAFGVTSRKSILEATTQLEIFRGAIGPLGSVTREQAVAVVAEAEKILKSISLLPIGQRAALADITVSLKATTERYKEHAENVAAFASSGTEAIEKATAARIASWEKERAALQGLQESAAAAEQDLLRTLKARDKRDGGRGGAEADELRALKGKPIQYAEDLARISELEAAGFEASGASAERAASRMGGLRDSQRETVASSEEVHAAIRKLVESLKGSGTVLNDLQAGAISTYLDRLRQTAERGGATASAIQDAFGAVQRTVKEAEQQQALLNDSTKAAEEAARAAAAQAGILGQGAKDIVGSVQKGGQTLLSDLETAVAKGGELIQRTVDTGRKGTEDVISLIQDGQIVITQAGSAAQVWAEKYSDGAQVVTKTVGDAADQTAALSRETESTGAAVDHLVPGVDKLGAGLATVALKGKDAREEVSGVASAAGDLASSVAGIGPALEEAGTGLQTIASGAADASEPVQRLAAGLETAGTAAPALAQVAKAIHDAGQDAPDLVRDLSQLEPAAKTEERALAYDHLAKALGASADAAGRLKSSLPSVKSIREEAAALKDLAEQLIAVAAGLEAERAAREGEAPN